MDFGLSVTDIGIALDAGMLLLLLLEITLKSQPAEIYIDVNYLTLKTTGAQCAIWGGGGGGVCYC